MISVGAIDLKYYKASIKGDHVLELCFVAW